MEGGSGPTTFQGLCFPCLDWALLGQQQQQGWGQTCPPTQGAQEESESCTARTCQGVVGVELQPKVPEAGEQLLLHLSGGGVVHALRGEVPGAAGQWPEEGPLPSCFKCSTQDHSSISSLTGCGMGWRRAR